MPSLSNVSKMIPSPMNDEEAPYAGPDREGWATYHKAIPSAPGDFGPCTRILRVIYVTIIIRAEIIDREKGKGTDLPLRHSHRLIMIRYVYTATGHGMSQYQTKQMKRDREYQSVPKYTKRAGKGRSEPNQLLSENSGA